MMDIVHLIDDKSYPVSTSVLTRDMNKMQHQYNLTKITHCIDSKPRNS